MIQDLNAFKWFCEPARWQLLEGNLEMYTNANTDFWQRTHYGFQNDNAHFLHTNLAGDFEMQVRVHAYPVNKYDQAGLYVRIDADNWIKTSVEFIEEDLSYLGAVVTNLGYSDWSTQKFTTGPEGVDYKIVRDGADFEIYARAAEASDFQMIRICHLHKPALEIMAGLYACSPTDAGMKVFFNKFQIQYLSR
ncbi:MAG: DUF1349 domain-containing protein [Cyclobacteriaceae bacterium]|nr:DUF1349 domain-containing protein [Cyclobacteriaceae bacterium]